MIRRLLLVGFLGVVACSGKSSTRASASAAETSEGDGPKGSARASASSAPASSVSVAAAFSGEAVDTAGAEVLVDGSMKLIVRPSKDPYGEIHQKALSRKDKGFDKMVSVLDQRFVLPRPLPIVFEDCGKVNAFYLGTPKSASIHMCYELLKDFDAKAQKAKPEWSDKERMVYVVNNIVFVFMHELGHALHKELKLPLTGKGEDAADEIATLMLVKNEAGEKLALAAAMGHEMSAKAREDAGRKPNYFDEHSLNEQRFFSILCLMYGAQPEKYEKLLTEYKIDKRQMTKCKREYDEKRAAWTSLLKPHVKGNFSL